jgi:hypothetical protein
MAYTKRYALGFNDSGPSGGTPADSQFLNALESALLKLFAVDPTVNAQTLLWNLANQRYEPGLITNANIDPAAAISRSKLAALGIVDADIAGGANIAASKLATGIPLSKLAGYTGVITDIPHGDGSWGPVVSNALVATTVAGLGAGTEGELGLIKVMPTTFNNGGATALPAATITVGDTSGFPTAGTVTTPAGTITFTGKTATTLTGCTGGTGTLAANAVITLATVTAGAADYDFVQLVYNAALGKWVSPEVQIAGAMANAANATWTVAAAGVWASTASAVYQFPRRPNWRAFDAAGLKPQARIAGQFIAGANALTNWQMRVHWYGINSGASSASVDNTGDTNSAGTVVATTVVSGSYSMKTRWSDIPGGYTITDDLVLGADLMDTAGTAGGTVTATAFEAFLRWVG